MSIAADAGKLREIATDDIDEMIKLEQSSMPTGLANLCGQVAGKAFSTWPSL